MYVTPGNCDSTATSTVKISIEDMMSKLLKGVESIDTGVREMKSDLSSMSQLVDSHSTFIKHLEH